jgi:hypothetical protein
MQWNDICMLDTCATQILHTSHTGTCYVHAQLLAVYYPGIHIAQEVSRWLPTASARVRAGGSHVGFVEEKVTLGQVFSGCFGYPCQFSFHQLLHNRSQLSSGADNKRPVVGAVPSGLSLTPLRIIIIKSLTFILTSPNSTEQREVSLKLKVTQLLSTLLGCYGTRRSITVLSTAPYLQSGIQ